MRNRRSGFTLAEVLVVIAIIVVLAATLWALLGPVVKDRGLETRVKSDMRQIAFAVNVYMADNDGRYPLGMRSLPKDVPRICQGCARYLMPPKDGDFDGEYFYTQMIFAQRLDERYAGVVRNPFDPATMPIVKAPFFNRIAPDYMHEEFSGPGRYTIVKGNGGKLGIPLVPCARLDGSIMWERFFSNRDWEIAGSLSYVLK